MTDTIRDELAKALENLIPRFVGCMIAAGSAQEYAEIAVKPHCAALARHSAAKEAERDILAMIEVISERYMKAGHCTPDDLLNDLGDIRIEIKRWHAAAGEKP